MPGVAGSAGEESTLRITQRQQNPQPGGCQPGATLSSQKPPSPPTGLRARGSPLLTSPNDKDSLWSESTGRILYNVTRSRTDISSAKLALLCWSEAGPPSGLKGRGSHVSTNTRQGGSWGHPWKPQSCPACSVPPLQQLTCVGEPWAGLASASSTAQHLQHLPRQLPLWLSSTSLLSPHPVPPPSFSLQRLPPPFSLMKPARA